MARYCFLLHVRPELLPEYRQRHAAVWPDMLRALREAGLDGQAPDEGIVALEEVFHLEDQLTRLEGDTQ